MTPAYNLIDLIHACNEQGQVVLIGNSANSARDDFGLITQKDVLEFIANNGMESPSHINTKHWERNPQPTKPIMVDAYSFYSGSKHGYLAFFFSHTNKWLIKSFKCNADKTPRNISPMQKQLVEIKKLMSCPEEK
ncbi:MAG: hypothetical protein KAJ63_09050 [Methyloprofundus sp.]|nr:hypothetical protein [Methyloprofundus sp.]